MTSIEKIHSEISSNLDTSLIREAGDCYEIIDRIKPLGHASPEIVIIGHVKKDISNVSPGDLELLEETEKYFTQALEDDKFLNKGVHEQYILPVIQFTKRCKEVIA